MSEYPRIRVSGPPRQRGWAYGEQARDRIHRSVAGYRQAFAHWIATGTEPGGRTVPPDLAYAAPVPVPGRAGDVVFLHYLLVHASSHNHSDDIRVGLNGTIRPDPVPTDYPKIGPPRPDWTPIDRTLRIDDLNVSRRQE